MCIRDRVRRTGEGTAWAVFRATRTAFTVVPQCRATAFPARCATAPCPSARRRFITAPVSMVTGHAVTQRLSAAQLSTAA